MRKSPKLFTCPKCHHRYLGHDPLPDCPSCGYDYHEKEGFRWDMIVYLLAILAMVSFLLVASYYRGNVSSRITSDRSTLSLPDSETEKLPGSRTTRGQPFQSPYHEQNR